MSQLLAWSGFQRGLRWMSGASIFACSCAMVVLVAIFGWLVFGRYVLNATPTWVEQLALLLVVYITFLGSATGVYEGTHLGVTFLRDALPGPLRRIATVIADTAVAGFGLVMMVACLELFEFGWSTKLPMLDVPESFRTLPAVLCGGMMFLFAGTRVVGGIAGFIQGSSVAGEEG
jgi:TRAP-type transport system small permease protein